MAGGHHTHGKSQGQTSHRFPSEKSRCCTCSLTGALTTTFCTPSLLLVHKSNSKQNCACICLKHLKIVVEQINGKRSQVVCFFKARFWVRSGRAPRQKNVSPLRRRWGASFVMRRLYPTKWPQGFRTFQNHQPGIGLILLAGWEAQGGVQPVSLPSLCSGCLFSFSDFSGREDIRVVNFEHRLLKIKRK